MKPWLAPLLVLLVGGCAPTYDKPDSPYYLVPTGSRLTLLTDLEFQPDQGILHFQFGETIPAPAVRELQPYCVMYPYTVSEQRQVIKPGEFEIYRVNRGAGPLWVGAPVMVAQMDDDGPSHWYYKTYLYAQSPTRAERFQLICLVDRLTASGLIGSWLTVDEIRETLQGIFTLTLAGETDKS